MVAIRLRKRNDGMAAVRVHRIRQNDDVGAAERVNPYRRARVAGVAVGADRKQFAAIAGIGRIDIPAQAAQNRLVGRRLRGSEFLNRGGAEQADAIALASVQHHLRKLREIGSGGEHTRVARYATHVARGIVMHLAAQRLARRWIDFGGGDARAERGRRQKHRFMHAQRLVEVFARIFVQHFSGEPMHDFAQ